MHLVWEEVQADSDCLVLRWGRIFFVVEEARELEDLVLGEMNLYLLWIDKDFTEIMYVIDINYKSFQSIYFFL